jgi:methionyl-tRNA formyltransferase
MRVLFLGSGPIAKLCLQSILDRSEQHSLCGIVGPQDLREALDDQGLVSLPLELARRQEEELLEAIRESRPDVAVSVQYPWILSSHVIDALHGRIINLHNARLPDYRGHHSISHALLNRDKAYTSTLHWMAPEVDRGRCIDTETIDIHADDTAQSLWSRTVVSCVALIERLFDGASDVEDIPVGTQISPGGKFYSRKMLGALKRVPAEASVEQMALVARACHFPPYEPAYLEVGGHKTYLLATSYCYLSSEIERPVLSVPPPADR